MNGVSIRYANSSTMPHPSKSWLIDTTPGHRHVRGLAARGRQDVHATRCAASRSRRVAVSPLGALVKITVPNGADTTPPGYPGGLTASLVGGRAPPRVDRGRLTTPAWSSTTSCDGTASLLADV